LPVTDRDFIKEKLIMRQIGSTVLALAACMALLAAPAFAQSAAPAAKPAPAMKMAPGEKMAAKPKHKFSCYDYAWQSKDMQDCLAKASAKPAAAKAKATKSKSMKGMKGM
jgi:hypothetical protein